MKITQIRFSHTAGEIPETLVSTVEDRANRKHNPDWRDLYYELW